MHICIAPAPYRFVQGVGKPIVRCRREQGQRANTLGNDTLDRHRLSDRTEAAGYSRLPIRQYRDRFRHDLRQREKRSARTGQRSTHGNELCGAIALDFLPPWRPAGARTADAVLRQCRGISVLRSGRPGASRFIDEDFNRRLVSQVLDGPRNSVELIRARTLRPLYDTVDLLLDLHSMQHATPPLVLCGATERGRRLAQAVGVPEWIVSDSGHASGRRLLDYAGFADATGPRPPCWPNAASIGSATRHPWRSRQRCASCSPPALSIRNSPPPT